MFEPLTSFEAQALWLSLKVATVALVGASPVALALAWLLARRQFPGKWLVEALVNLPLVLPPVVTGLGLLLLFGARGPIGSWLLQTFGIRLAFEWTGAALAAAVMALPLMIRPLRLALEAVDPRLEAAAATLGASPWRVWTRVTLPLAAPGLIAGLVLGFARCFGEFGATVTFAGSIAGETRTLSVAIYSALQSTTGETAALRLAVLSVLVSMAALILAEALNRRLWRGRRGS